MANRYHAKFMVIDTTNTQIGGSAPTGGVKGELHIRAIKWVSTTAKPIANDDVLTIEYGDANGDIVIAAIAAVHETATSQDTGGAVYYSVEFGGSPWIVSGLYVEDLSSGEIQIFLA